ncbi:hypothetical protein QJS10_CPA01g02653 [Acorus calamus]|uniref:Uncharacterized protein n=1 Tax=Acorus calamus TaxID=4465 RepID=A0AAV9FHR2_ACOCL|nr:hypothetical protein QJS10_CPA01g02653 [Acorus calamus]
MLEGRRRWQFMITTQSSLWDWTLACLWSGLWLALGGMSSCMSGSMGLTPGPLEDLGGLLYSTGNLPVFVIMVDDMVLVRKKHYKDCWRGFKKKKAVEKSMRGCVQVFNVCDSLFTQGLGCLKLHYHNIDVENALLGNTSTNVPVGWWGNGPLATTDFFI